MNYVFRLCILGFLLVSSCNNIKNETKTAALHDSKAQFKETKGTITFPSKDGLSITADVYVVNNNPVSILLCHQAGYSRGEYKDTAIRLNALGYSVMAIDQRSGNIANQVKNKTNAAAKLKGLPTTYLDAKQDIEAAVDYVYAHNNNKPIVLVGSSYSASLSLLIAAQNDKIKSVAAFSPGEYFKGMHIQELIKTTAKPMFVTASNSETSDLKRLVSKVDRNYLTHYMPKEKGIHGSRALWSSTSGTKGYWDAFETFLKTSN